MRRSLRRSLCLVLTFVLGAGLFGVAATPGAAEARFQAGSQRKARPPARIAPRLSDDAQNREIRIHNQTGWTMTHLYPSSGEAWGADLLGSGIVSPGDSVVVTVDDGSGACRYALRAAFDNGQTLQRGEIDVCRVADYYFTR